MRSENLNLKGNNRLSLYKIDKMGGAISAIENGYIQKEIETRAYEIQKEIEQNKRVIVGVNRYKVDEKVETALFKADPDVASRQIQNLRTLKTERDGKKVEAALQAIEKAAKGDENLMPHFLGAVKCYATLGEICDVLRQVFGEFHASGTL